MGVSGVWLGLQLECSLIDAYKPKHRPVGYCTDVEQVCASLCAKSFSVVAKNRSG